MVTDNLDVTEARIQAACDRAGRDRDEVTLIAVSKTKPISMLQEAYQAGIREFGENKVQEMMDKYDMMPGDIHWHMIGHLQRNKVKYLIGKAALIHSVDSIRLAEEISAQSVKNQKETDILIEVNIAGEETKYGLSDEETIRFVQEAAKLPNIRIQGLMTIAPFVDDPEDNRLYFRKIRELAVDIDSKKIDNVTMRILSKGISGAYEGAIIVGATMIRVGTGIFGKRDYGSRS